MKKLIESLKPEILEVIENDRILYPNSIQLLLDALEQNFFVSDLKYSVALDLMSKYRSAFGLLPNNAWECFVEK